MGSQIQITFSLDNASALNFVEFDKHIFILGDDEQIDILMHLNIQVA